MKMYITKTRSVWISYPVAIKDIDNLETLNNLSINVFSLENKKRVFPLRISKEIQPHHVDLLYISDNDINHYVLIKNISRLISSQLSSNKRHTFICPYCLHGCKTKDILDRHMERCKLHGAQRVKLPTPEKNDNKVPIKFHKNRISTSFAFCIVC